MSCGTNAMQSESGLGCTCKGGYFLNKVSAFYGSNPSGTRAKCAFGDPDGQPQQCYGCEYTIRI